ncbi:hypothetical protein KO465_10325 [Candidatus Micrarchaeota archaeon]|nr:hypothetical protein [Candidatus Micrarchaeota archaeon]
MNEVNFFNIEQSETGKLEYVIDKLADFFNVSKQAAKIRLIDLGYTAVTGINNYINKDKIPNYLIKEETISRDHTYIIDFIDSVRQVKTNINLSRLSKEGKITYVEGFLVVNSQKYVYINDDGKKKLTQYALENIEECALL